MKKGGYASPRPRTHLNLIDLNAFANEKWKMENEKKGGYASPRPVSPCPRVSVSPRPRVPASPRLRVPGSPRGRLLLGQAVDCSHAPYERLAIEPHHRAIRENPANRV